jgi:hypothetical protein
VQNKDLHLFIIGYYPYRSRNMKTPLEQFIWGKPEGGFEWKDAIPAKFPAPFNDPRLTERDLKETRFLRLRESSGLADPIYPLQDEPLLFRAFARLEPNEDGFLAFANQYGWLGVTVFLEEQGEGQRVVNFNTQGQGEPWWRWLFARQQMRDVDQLLEPIQLKDTATLRQWFTVLEDGVRYEKPGPYGPHMAWVCSSKNHLRPWLWTWGNAAPTDDERLLRFASGFAQEQINKVMSGTPTDARTSVRVLLNHEKDGMMVHIVPDNLLAAMWLQCARVLTDNPSFRACENCGKWFELSSDARRSDTKYCSDKCKVAAYRTKKRKAKS